MNIKVGTSRVHFSPNNIVHVYLCMFIIYLPIYSYYRNFFADKAFELVLCILQSWTRNLSQNHGQGKFKSLLIKCV